MKLLQFGDNQNDIEMVSNAGLGIVMGKSALASKNLGKIVVSDNDSSGVAEAIFDYII